MASQSNPLPTCNAYITPQASYRSSPFTPRRAVDPRARFASFYDARQDKVITNASAHLPSQSIPPLQDISCSMKTDLSEARLNLLQSINMHDDLRLSLALQMTRAIGMGALINYSPAIDNNTRILSYTTITRTEHVPDRDLQRLLKQQKDQQDVVGTHVVIFINYGIDVLLLLQLPAHDRQLAGDIDQILNQLCTILSSGAEVRWKGNEEAVLRQITHTQVFSNMSRLTECKSIIDFCKIIYPIRKTTADHPPYNYNLCPITKLFKVNDEEQVYYKEMSRECVQRIELLLLLSRDMKRLEEEMQKLSPLCEKYRNDWDEIRQLHGQEVQRLGEWVYKARMGKVEESQIDQLLADEVAQIVFRKTEMLPKKLEKTPMRNETIQAELQRNAFEYRKAANYDLKTDDDEKTVIKKLSGYEKNLVILCGTDQLINEDQTRWNTLCDRAIKELQSSPNRRVAYFDFTDHAYPLSKLILSCSEESLKEEDEIVNILLLGESGVGKSTFINALVNYLRFDTFEDADKKSPIVLLPISFMVTIGRNFNEEQVEYPGIDGGSEEVHGQRGQSVTQHCRSYLFTMKDNQGKEKKVRLVDTPGFADSRGMDQDERSMDEIMAFIQGLDRIHAVCMMMKPNVTRLTIAFRSRFRQMVELLGADAADHILFCFTNSRATFYCPGSTSPILRTLLESFTSVKIPLKKENSFCFDSESFRYLVAKQKQIEFDPDETDQIKETWGRSSKTSKLFFEAIWKRKNGYKIYDDLRSLTMAKFKIHLLIRPLLEGIRNLSRNIISREENPMSKFIKLRPQAITDIKSVYHRCKERTKPCGNFKVLEDSCESMHSGCEKLKFPSDGPINDIQYCLDYEEKDGDQDLKKEKLEEKIGKFLEACVVFGCFLPADDLTKKSDRIALHFDAMIHEEDVLGRTDDKATYLNASLHGKLKKFQEEYQEGLQKKRQTAQNSINLKDVFECINKVSDDEMIQSQLKEVKQWQKLLVDQRQFIVDIPELCEK